MMSKDYYDILQVKAPSSASEIKTSYRRLALRYHPDKNKSSLAEEKFKNINEAYEILMNEAKKKLYDNDREREYNLKNNSDSNSIFNNLKNNFNEQFKDFQNTSSQNIFNSFAQTTSTSSIFNKIFGNSLHSNNTSFPSFCRFRINKDPDLTQEVSISLEEVLQGKEKFVDVITKSLSSTGVVDNKKGFKIDVKKGCCAGTKMKFAKEGNCISGWPIPGDIIFIITDKPHSSFIREGADIRYKAAISLEEALCGTTISIPTLERENVKQRLQIDEVIKPSSTKIINGQGLPFQHQPHIRGDLVVEFDILFPDSISPHNKQTLSHCLRT